MFTVKIIGSIYQPMKVYLADDSLLIRQTLNAKLSKIAGLEVVGEAADGLVASHEILSLKPDLVILDIRMPSRNGIDVLRDIKQRGLQTKVIIITQYNYPQYRRRCMEEKADYFFDKSSDINRMIELIGTISSSDDD